jgi:hypothetical protein
MRFTISEPVRSGPIRGAVSKAILSCNTFHTVYEGISRALFSPQDGIIHAVVVEPWPFGDADVLRRRIYDSEPDGEPLLHAAAMNMMELRDGRSDEDHLVVAVPRTIADKMPNGAAMLMLVVMDAASWACDAGCVCEELEWADPDMRRAAIAARFLRAAEGGGLIGAVEASGCYLEICANALEGMAGRRHEENGEALIARETPGLVSLLHDVVEHARHSIPARLPLCAHATAVTACDVLGTLISRRIQDGSHGAASV